MEGMAVGTTYLLPDSPKEEFARNRRFWRLEITMIVSVGAMEDGCC